jgi:hypothetical protein
MTASGATVTAPAGYYENGASKTVASGTAGTPTATKGSVSNHSVSVTPSVTNTTGYISGGTKSGTALTITAAELVSGTKTINDNGTGIDVTNYATVDVDVASGSGGMRIVETPDPAGGTVLTITGEEIVLQSKTITPSTTQQIVQPDTGYTGLDQVTVGAMPTGTAGTPVATKGTVSNHSIAVTPSVTNATGYISGGTKSGTAVTVSASELVSGTKSISANGTGIDVTDYASVDVAVPTPTPSLQAKTHVEPTESSQTITADSGYDGLSSVQIDGIDPDYVGSNVTRRSSSDLHEYETVVQISGRYYTRGAVGAPAGMYDADAEIILTEGSATVSATKGTVSNHSIQITPKVTKTAGYISAGSGSGTAVTVTASELVSGSQTVTSNDTYDVTNLASLIVNVSGGTSAWTLIDHREVTTTQTSTTAATAATISCGSAGYTKDRIIWVHVRDKAGKRAGYFYGSDAFFVNYQKAQGGTTTLTVPAVLCMRYTTASAFAATAGQYGVYGYSINSSGSLIVRKRYNSSYSLTIDGTYVIDVYYLDPPSGITLFP